MTTFQNSDMKDTVSYSSMLNFNIDESQFYNNYPSDFADFFPSQQKPFEADEYLNNNLDGSLQEALLSFQDLDIPASTTFGKESYKKHTKQPSGTAIFGFHGKDLSIPGINPVDLGNLNRDFKDYKPASHDRNIDPKAITLSKDYIISSNKPSKYKFPPENQPPPPPPVNNYFTPEYLNKMSRVISGNVAEQMPVYPNSIDDMLDQSDFTCSTNPTTAHSSPTKRDFNVNNLTVNVPAPHHTTPELKSQSSYVYMTPSPKYGNFNAPHTNSSTTPFSSPEYYVQQGATPSSYHGSPVKSNDPIFWEEIMTVNENQSQEALLMAQKNKRKGSEKVSTLPPGSIDQFIIGPDDNKKYVCNYNGCGKLFQRRYNIRSHIQTHLCDRPYKCPFDNCKKSFVRQHDLHRHEKIHESNKYICLCDKGFTRIDALRRHKERNICLGGIKTEGNISKPKKKRGRPKKIITEKKLTLQLDTGLNKNLDDDIFCLDNKENSFSDKTSNPVTPLCGKVLGLSTRF